jgi:hypothetical protein
MFPTLNKEQTGDRIWAEHFRKNQISGELSGLPSGLLLSGSSVRTTTSILCAFLPPCFIPLYFTWTCGRYLVKSNIHGAPLCVLLFRLLSVHLSYNQISSLESCSRTSSTLATGILFLLFTCMHVLVWGTLRRWSAFAPTAYEVARDCRK